MLREFVNLFLIYVGNVFDSDRICGSETGDCLAADAFRASNLDCAYENVVDCYRAASATSIGEVEVLLTYRDQRLTDVHGEGEFTDWLLNSRT